MRVINVRIDEKMLETIDMVAKANSAGRSFMIRHLIRKGLEILARAEK